MTKAKIEAAKKKLEERISGFRDEIDEHENSISTLENKIEDIEAAIDKIDEDIAQYVALSPAEQIEVVALEAQEQRQKDWLHAVYGNRATSVADWWSRALGIDENGNPVLARDET